MDKTRKYNPSMDYKSAHLSWVKSHPNFIPERTAMVGTEYFESLKFLYYSVESKYVDNKFAYQLRESDIIYDDSLKLDLLPNSVTTDAPKFFVTIGFNHQTWNINTCVKVIETILSFDWIISCRSVFELHRENGEHPHCHFLMETTKMYKSKILEKIWATRGIKSVCLKKSFIDCKPAEQYHEDYINLIKQESKMKYVAMDTKWRSRHNIPEHFTK